ncbi:MAG: c-type cytochrome [Candidatus Methylomirabilia bacterium]
MAGLRPQAEEFRLEDYGVALVGEADPFRLSKGRSSQGGSGEVQFGVATMAQDTRRVVSGNVYQGWKWWHVYCFRCHGIDAAGGSAPDLRGPIKGKITREAFIQVVLDGRPNKGMPAWNQLLNEGQVKQIYQYVLERAEGRLPAGEPTRAETNKGGS